MACKAEEAIRAKAVKQEIGQIFVSGLSKLVYEMMASTFLGKICCCWRW
jgi:hypothetical protein